MTLHLVKAGHDRQRLELREKITRLAGALATGEIQMSAVELEALAQICADHWLPAEAARVRRWKARAS